MHSLDWLAQEMQRLHDLDCYHVSASPGREEFSSLSHLAAYVCHTPFAAVSFVGEHTHWFESRVGFPRTEFPREGSFCSEAIESDAIFQVKDARKDRRFCSNPLVIGEEGVRFYAAAVVASCSGYRLGTLCVSDRVPRSLSRRQRDALKSLAALVTAQLELRKCSSTIWRQRTSLRELVIKVAEGDAALESAEKFSLLGRANAEMSHELVNHLSVIVGRAELLLSRMSVGENDATSHRASIASILRSARAIDSIVRSTNIYARDGKRDPLVATNLAKLLGSLGELVESKFRTSGVVLLIEAGWDLEVLCRPSEILQILFNLLENAVDAMANVEHEKIVSIHCTRTDGFVEILVSDTGKGMDAAIKESVMSPFFTTKAAGLGTGLGLSVSAKLAKSNGGTLSIVPAKRGMGASFQLRIPAGGTFAAH